MQTTNNLTTYAAVPRLKPIERPASLKLKMAYWYTRRLLGIVITPLKVHYARVPEALGLSREMITSEARLSLNPRLKSLIKVYIATLNGCAFCVDIGMAQDGNVQMDPGMFEDLLRFKESDLFSEAEKSLPLVNLSQEPEKLRIFSSNFGEKTPMRFIPTTGLSTANPASSST